MCAAEATASRVSATGRAEASPETDLRACLERARSAFDAERYPDLRTRRARLLALERAVRSRADRLIAAAQADFGCRSPHETRITEVVMVVRALRHARRRLRTWMRPQRVPVELEFRPGRARIVRQPLGVVGILSPWNYPYQLALLPLSAALAAGNRAMIKPSEITPRCAEELDTLIRDAFEDTSLVQVVQGGPEVGAAFSALPFDHIIYTGSTAVGRLVMQAAAKNLVPVTLELGGKSPVLVHPTFPLEEAARRITFGKGFNGGQTCIAPDYVFIDRPRRDGLVQAIEACQARFYPRLAGNHDFTSVVNEHHARRLLDLVEDAREKGATVIEVNPAGERFSEAAHRLPLHLVLDPTDEMRVMQEEIFGPILPVLTYDRIEEAIDYVNAHPRPLALYYFDRDRHRVRHLLEQTIAGMVTVNDTLTHAVVEELPFGGVGASGMGAYHGFHGFRTFSHEKAVFLQSRLHGMNLMNPPYGRLIERFLDFMMR